MTTTEIPREDLYARAHAASEAGRFEEAARYGEQLAERDLLSPGLDDTATHITLINLALANFGLGRAARSEELLNRVLESELRTLGPDHGYPWMTRALLAEAVGAQGRYEEAAAHLQQVLDRAEAHGWPRHDAAIRARLAQARVLGRQQHWDRALPLARQAATEAAAAIPIPVALSARQLLGTCLRQTGELEEAELVTRSVLEDRRTYNGTTHPFTLEAASDLVLVLEAAGTPGRAREVAEEWAAPACATLRGDHTAVAVLTAALARP
ncbi:tetratricopeptide repeat protein [Streptacidiphilus cavernicola]|uniref:Tetratricopeptide repeat protein n=1 Tax=Streptacidiphilus cavernicola TaxID=3342716 RepID=A0ABV6VYK0_9ACTN